MLFFLYESQKDRIRCNKFGFRKVGYISLISKEGNS